MLQELEEPDKLREVNYSNYKGERQVLAVQACNRIQTNTLQYLIYLYMLINF